MICGSCPLDCVRYAHNLMGALPGVGALRQLPSNARTSFAERSETSEASYGIVYRCIYNFYAVDDFLRNMNKHL